MPIIRDRKSEANIAPGQCDDGPALRQQNDGEQSLDGVTLAATR
jgi:hypothetical protein